MITFKMKLSSVKNKIRLHFSSQDAQLHVHVHVSPWIDAALGRL